MKRSLRSHCELSKLRPVPATCPVTRSSPYSEWLDNANMCEPDGNVFFIFFRLSQVRVMLRTAGAGMLVASRWLLEKLEALVLSHGVRKPM